MENPRPGSFPRSVDEVDWTAYRFTEDAVLCFIRDGRRLWLINKKTGLGAGKVNAPGGRIEKGESAPAAAVRETIEETGLAPWGLEQTAELNFIFTDGYSLRGFVFFACGYGGAAISTEEADPFWCEVDKLPFPSMWADDIVWLPRVLAGEKILGRFIFDGDRMLSHVLHPLIHRHDTVRGPAPSEVTVGGRVVSGHAVASGAAPDSPYPGGTIALQTPHFRRLGLDITMYHAATVNVTISPSYLRLINPPHLFRGVRWIDSIPAEDFSFARCGLQFEDKYYEGLVYYPHPRTKPAHFQEKHVVELLMPFVENLRTGSRVSLSFRTAEVELKKG